MASNLILPAPDNESVARPVRVSRPQPLRGAFGSLYTRTSWVKISQLFRGRQGKTAPLSYREAFENGRNLHKNLHSYSGMIYKSFIIMAKLADAADLKSADQKWLWGFKSPSRYHVFSELQPM